MTQRDGTDIYTYEGPTTFWDNANYDGGAQFRQGTDYTLLDEEVARALGLDDNQEVKRVRVTVEVLER